MTKMNKMNKFACDRCFKVFVLKSDLIRHLNKKIPCEKVVYNTESKNIINNTIDNLVEKLDIILLNNQKMQEKIDDLSEENKNLREESKNLQQRMEKMENMIKENYDKTVNNTVNNIVNVNINLVSHGKEDYEFISENLWKQIFSKGFGSIYKFIECVHFNKNKPEYHNVYLPSKKQNMYVMVFDGTKWKLVKKKEIITALKENGIGFIEGKFDELNKQNKLPESAKRGMLNFLNEYNNTNNIQNENDDNAKNKLDIDIEKEIELILYNNKDIAIETKNKIEKNKQKEN